MSDQNLIKGLNNNHELLKQADTNDSSGMIKYSIDLDAGVEKLSEQKGKDTNG